MTEKSIILIRTSTKDQNPKLQLADCENYNKSKTWNCIKTFEKQESAYKSEDGVWKEELDFAIKNQVKHIIVWNMDRFSRQPEELVLKQVKVLSVVHNLQIHAVNGDTWSELVESIGKLKELGFIGEALLEFLEKLLKGLEFQRANRESKVKSERVKLAVRKESGITKSYKGNKWGRKVINKKVYEQILELHEQGKNIREIAKEVFYWNASNHKKFVSTGYVHKIITMFKAKKEPQMAVQDLLD